MPLLIPVLHCAQRCHEVGLTRWVDKPIRRGELWAALQGADATPIAGHGDEGSQGAPPLFDAAARTLLAEDNLTSSWSP